MLGATGRSADSNERILCNGVQGKHRVVYDDGEVGTEDLQHKKHRLPDLTGDEVLNPDADALSSSDSDEDALQTGTRLLLATVADQSRCIITFRVDCKYSGLQQLSAIVLAYNGKFRMRMSTSVTT